MTKLTEDLATITFPFDLFSGVSIVIEELKNKGFEYSHLTHSRTEVLTFTSQEQEIDVSVEKENLLIKQYSINGGARKLIVIYVVKPTQRNFKLVQV